MAHSLKMPLHLPAQCSLFTIAPSRHRHDESDDYHAGEHEYRKRPHRLVPIVLLGHRGLGSRFRRFNPAGESAEKRSVSKFVQPTAVNSEPVYTDYMADSWPPSLRSDILHTGN
jgi:hypothetical protein